MRLSARIVVFLLLACVVPLVVLAASAVRVAQDWLDATIVDVQAQSARLLATSVAEGLEDGERVLRLHLGNFHLDRASDETRAAFLYATWRLSPDISVVVLQDAAGRDLVDPVYQRPGEVVLAPDHEVVHAARVERFLGFVPVPVGAGSVARGAPYLAEPGSPVLPLAFASPWGDGLVLGVELRLGGALERAGYTAEGGREVVLMDNDGHVLQRVGRTGLVEAERIAPLAGAASADLRYVAGGGEEVVGALVAVPGYPLAVLVAQPAAPGTAAAKDIRLRTWYIGGVSLTMALAVGLLLGRSITAPILKLREAAVAVGRGDLTRRVHLEGRDEVAELAQAFNRMTGNLEANAGEIAAKNKEIEEFNQELQARVEQRTAQLREAQARLVQSGQLAAVAELSAGVAHELNNPLAGVVGLLQIVLAKRPSGGDAELLRSAEREALRCRDIISSLERFTRPPARGAVERFDLDGVCTDVLVLLAEPLRQRGVGVDHRRAPSPLWVRGDPSSLGRALGQLLTAIRSVAAPGATLTIAASAAEGGVDLTCALDQATRSRDDWRAAGLAFWVARQVFAEHDATLAMPELAELARGEPSVALAPAVVGNTGYAWRLRLPAAA